MSDNLEIKNGFIRLMPPTMPMTAAFMSMNNISKNENIKIVKLESSLAVFTEFHVSIIHPDGTGTMEHLETIDIKKESSVELERGGKHIMFMRLKEKLKLDDKHTVTFFFSDGSKKQITLAIERIK